MDAPFCPGDRVEKLGDPWRRGETLIVQAVGKTHITCRFETDGTIVVLPIGELRLVPTKAKA